MYTINSWSCKFMNSNFDSHFQTAASVGGYGLWGKIPMESLYLSWEKCVNLNLGHRAEMLSTMDMHSCFLEVHLELKSICKLLCYVPFSGLLLGTNLRSPFSFDWVFDARLWLSEYGLECLVRE